MQCHDKMASIRLAAGVDDAYSPKVLLLAREVHICKTQRRRKVGTVRSIEEGCSRESRRKTDCPAAVLGLCELGGDSGSDSP